MAFRVFSSRIQRAAVLILLTLLTILYPTIIEPNWLQVTTLDLTLPHLDKAFNQFRLIHLSDIHADDWMSA